MQRFLFRLKYIGIRMEGIPGKPERPDRRKKVAGFVAQFRRWYFRVIMQLHSFPTNTVFKYGTVVSQFRKRPGLAFAIV